MVDSSPEVPRLEEVNRVKVGDVDSPGVWLRTLAPVLLIMTSVSTLSALREVGLYLYMHPEEADVYSVLLLKGKHGPGSVWEVVHHLTSVDVSN